ncbi:hypothetical protein, partial [Thermomonas sp.]|uniref:hypothetical protein n=1 Tax=Thermomonas sp. TaxID=1971895 RepID=UPI003784E6B6
MKPAVPVTKTFILIPRKCMPTRHFATFMKENHSRYQQPIESTQAISCRYTTEPSPSCTSMRPVGF